ncbi:MAG: non-ribosomal peptide synthetase, partial [Thermoanaerobaculia bacterium]
DLPTDRPRPRAAAHAGARVGRRLGPRLTGRVRELARAHGATLFTTLLAAFEALLGRLTGQADLLVGSPATARRDAAFDGVVGYFVNPVVLRADLAGDPPFAAHLAETRRAVAAALEHRDRPFPLLARRLQPVRDPARPPVFQVLFAFQSAAPGQEPGLAGFAVGQAASRIEVDGLALESLPLDRGTAQFDLTLSAAEAGDALVLSCEHDIALFDRVTIERWLGHLETLLDAAAVRPEARLGELPLLSEAERHQARIEWNPSGAWPDDLSLVEMFESWVDRAPEAVAVLAPGETLTYAELDRRANRLAHRLRALGATIDGSVGLCVERSPAMIVAVLGILKAGAAYVPLDPAYPRERLAFLVEDARIPVLLTEDRLLGVLPETAAATVLLDAHDSGDAGRPPRAATPDSLAYVIHTSGSTGRPKGAMVHHRGLGNLADAQRRLFDIRPGDRVLQFASLSFDASASEIAMTLSAGAALVLGPRERRLSREELTALLRESTVATLPPAVLGTLSPGDLPGLRTLIVAGEACPLDLARRWSAGRRFFNAYGPTEASVCATVK